MRVLLHIGVWKTGSTAIQAFLDRNAKALAARGVISPSFTRAPFGHEAVVRALRTGGNRRLDALMRTIARESQGKRKARILLSSEHYWLMNRSKRLRLAEALKTVADDVRVIAYIRPQEDMWASLYAQQAKGLRVREGSALWGEADFVGPAIAHRGLYFARCFDGFRRAFGPRLSVRLYNRTAFEGGDVVRDFLSAIRVRPEGLDLSAEDINASFGWKAVAFSIRIAEHLAANGGKGQDGRALRLSLHEAMAETAAAFRDPDWMGRSPNYLDESVRSDIRARYADDTARLSETYFAGAPVFQDRAAPPLSPRDFAQIPAEEVAYAAEVFDRRLKARAGLFGRPRLQLSALKSGL